MQSRKRSFRQQFLEARWTSRTHTLAVKWNYREWSLSGAPNSTEPIFHEEYFFAIFPRKRSLRPDSRIKPALNESTLAAQQTWKERFSSGRSSLTKRELILRRNLAGRSFVEVLALMAADLGLWLSLTALRSAALSVFVRHHFRWCIFLRMDLLMRVGNFI